MNWRAFWDELARREADPQRQVARLRGQAPLGAAELQRQLAHLRQLLDLQPQDRLLDLCCGNGLLTRPLAAQCRAVEAIDLVPAMIETARAQFAAPNLRYQVGDAAAADQLIAGPFDKILLHFSFQYFEWEPGARTLRAMAQLLAPGGRIVLSDVPERARLAAFYPRWQDRLRYHLERLQGRNLMGRFWSLDELQRIAMPLGLQVRRHAQPADLPYAHYRCDYSLSWRA